MGFYDTTINEGAMYANLDFMDLVEDATIPDLPASSSLLEDALFAISESEENYNNIMKACALNELCHFQENGTEYVFTEASGTGFIAAAKEFFRKIWEKIKSLFKKFAIMIARFVQDDKTFVQKNKNMIVNGMSNIPKDAEFKGYTFAGIAGWTNTLSTAKTDIDAVWGNVNAREVGHEYGPQSDDYDKEDKVKEFRAKIAGDKGNNDMDKSEFNKVMNEIFRGSDSKDSIVLNAAKVNEYMAELTSSKETRTETNKAFKAFNDIFKQIDKKLEGLSKEITGSYGKEGYNADTATQNLVGTRRAIDENKGKMSVIEAANAIWLTCLKDRSRQAKAICVKVATYKDASKVKNEGAGFTHYEGAGFLENVVLR